MRFYNTLTRKKEEFKPIVKGKVGIYSCGPTVYNYAHIGNLRSFLFSDLLRRYLKYKGYFVNHVMNLTDVDDKTIRDSKKEGLSLKEFTEKYTKLFFEDLDSLNVERVEHYPKATDHIKEMIDITKTLIDKGIAYTSDDGSTYYDVSAYKKYGGLSKIQVDSLKQGVRIKHDEYDKESAHDFALWKGYDQNDGDVFWETELGKGRPGWHIECSAMSMKYLGPHFDIHTGGIDLVFPHHENEIAQSQACSGEKFVNYWMHCEHLMVEGEKMSKSKGNFYTLRDLLDKGYTAKEVRYLLTSTHYRQQVNFTFEGLDGAKHTLHRFKEFLDKLKGVTGKEDNPIVKDMVCFAKENFEEAFDDDFNISKALATIFDFMRDINKLIASGKISRDDALQAYDLMMDLDRVLGVFEFKEETVPEDIIKLANARAKARTSKDWARADALRDEISKKGYVVKDKPDGFSLEKK